MNLETLSFLFVTGLTNGAIYALLGLGLVLIYGVTRVVNIMQGEFVTLGALSTVSLMAGKCPATFALAFIGIAIWLGLERSKRLGGVQKLLVVLVAALIGLGAYLLLNRLMQGHPVPYLLAGLVSVLLVACLGALIYRFAIQTVPEGSEGLLYLIITTGIFIFIEGFNLIVFGSEGSNLPPVSSAVLGLGIVQVPAQKAFVLLAVSVLLVVLYLFFERTIAGKALRATAVNRLGSRLVGISPTRSGAIAWAVSAMISALAGVLIAPIIIVNFDTGLPLGLKGFIGAVISGFASYPGAVLGGVVVGLLEAFAGYINSSFREVIVYSLLFVILLARVVRFPTKRSARKGGS